MFGILRQHRWEFTIIVEDAEQKKLRNFFQHDIVYEIQFVTRSFLPRTFFDLLLQLIRNNMKRRNTESKEEILSILNDYQSPMSYDMIAERISVSIDRATVYRILNRFQEDGLTHKVVGPDGKQYFALCGDCEHSAHSHSHNHLHFQCLECHRVECLSEDFKVTLPKGYRAKYYNTFITGYCKSCNAA